MINELKQYTPDSTKILHTTSVDFNSRSNMVRPIHLVQYDDTLPIIAVTLYNSGKIYKVPEMYTSNIRLSKKDGTYIMNPALGCNEDRTVLYFEVTQNMTFVFGTFNPIIDIADENAHVAGSSSITVIVDQNPVQEDDIESSDEFITLVEYVRDARESADRSESEAKKSAASSAESAASASKSATSASESASSAEESKGYMEQAAASEANAAQSAEAAKASEDAAAQSKGEAEYWEAMSESYAHGGTGRRENESTDNSKFYSDQAGNAATSATADAASARADAANAERYLEQTIEEGANALKKLEDALSVALPLWNVNFETGNLEYEGGRFTWEIYRDTGHLMWEVVV